MTQFGIGQSVSRFEDPRLLRGQGQFIDDHNLPGQAHAVLVRSPHAHALIKSIHTQSALKAPGVLAVYTGEDVAADGLGTMKMTLPRKRPDGSPMFYRQHQGLSRGEVKYVGDPVALVVAETVWQAKDAAELVEVDYEPLPHAVTLADALAPGAPLLSDAPDNRVAESRYGDAAKARTAFEQASHVVRLDITNQRVAALSIEPRSVQAHIEQGRLVVRMSSQMPTGIRTQIVDLLGIREDQVRVLVGDVGGGFGMKTGAYPEDLKARSSLQAIPQRPLH